VPAGELKAGETLSTATGGLTIASIEPKLGIHRVFNIEVETDHCFYVSRSEILSHNVNGCAAKRPWDKDYTPEDLDGLSVVEGKTQGRDWRL